MHFALMQLADPIVCESCTFVACSQTGLIRSKLHFTEQVSCDLFKLPPGNCCTECTVSRPYGVPCEQTAAVPELVALNSREQQCLDQSARIDKIQFKQRRIYSDVAH